MPTGVQYLESLGVRVFMDSTNFISGAAKVRMETDKTLSSIEARIAKAHAKIQTLNNTVGPLSQKQIHQIELLKVSIVQLEQSAIKAKAAMYAFGTAAIGIPLLTASAAAVKNFATLDDAIHKSMATMQDYQMKYKDVLMEASIALSTGTPTKAAAFGEGFGEGAHTGHSIAESAVLLDTAQKASVVSGLTLVDTFKVMSQAQRNLGMEFENTEDRIRNFEQLADMITKGSQVAATSWEVFARGLADPKLGQAVRGMHMDPNQVGSVVLAYSQMGINSKNSSRSGVGLANFYRELQKSSALPQFAKVWQAENMNVLNEYGNLKKMSEIIGILANRLNGLSDAQKKGITDGLGFTRMSDAFMNTLLAVDSTGMSAAGMIMFFDEQLKESAGTLDKSYAVSIKSFNNQMHILWNNVTNASIAFGIYLAPAIELVAKGLNYLLEGFLRMNPVLRGLIAVSILAVSFTLLGVSISLLVYQISKITIVAAIFSKTWAILSFSVKGLWSILTFGIPLMGYIAAGFKSMGVAIAYLFTGAWTLGGVFASISAGIWAAITGFIAVLPVILGIAAAIALIYVLYRTGALTSIWESAKTGFGGLAGILYNFSENWKILVDFMGDSWHKVIWQMFKEFSYFFLSLVAQAGVGLKMMFEDAWHAAHRKIIGVSNLETLAYRAADASEKLRYDPKYNLFAGTDAAGKEKYFPESLNDLLKYELENNPKFSQQRKLDLMVSKRLETPFAGRDVIGLPQFKTNLPEAPDWTKLKDKLYPMKDVGGFGENGLPDTFNAARAHEFVEMPQARFIIQGPERSPGDEKGFLMVDKRLQELIQATKENRPGEHSVDQNHPAKTPHAGNPAAASKHNQFPIHNFR